MASIASGAKLAAMFDRPPAAATATPPVPAHLVLGGALLILRAVVELVLASSLGVAPLGAVLWTGLLVDVVLGALIVVGSPRAIAVAILRVTFGALVVLLVAIGARVISLALGSAAVLAALAGVPGAARRRAAIALFIAHVLGVVVFLASWRAPSDGLGAEVTVLEGSQLPYRISFPSNGWRMRDAELVLAEAPDALAWLVRPEVGGNVMVAARLGADPSTTDLDDLERRPRRDERRDPEPRVTRARSTAAHASADRRHRGLLRRRSPPRARRRVSRGREHRRAEHVLRARVGAGGHRSILRDGAVNDTRMPDTTRNSAE